MSKVCLNASFSYYDLPSASSPFDEIIPNLTIGDILKCKVGNVLDGEGERTVSVTVDDIKNKQEGKENVLFDELKKELEK